MTNAKIFTDFKKRQLLTKQFRKVITNAKIFTDFKKSVITDFSKCQTFS